MPLNPEYFVLAEANTGRLPLGLPAVHRDSEETKPLSLPR